MRHVLNGLALTLTFPMIGSSSFAYETSPNPRVPIEYLVYQLLQWGIE